MNSLIQHGRRLVHLRRFSLPNASAFSESFSSAVVSSGDSEKGQKFTVSYLVDSLGFTRKLAESILKKVSFEEKSNPDSVLKLLTSYSFTDSQISSIIKDYPGLLILDADKCIGPKLAFLQSRQGASSSELTEILSNVPKIFGIKKDKAIGIYYDFVKEILVANKSSKFVKLCPSSLPQEGSKQVNKMRNVSVLRELGVRPQFLFTLLVSNNGFCCGKEKFKESLNKVVEMGFDPTTSKFVDALRVVYGMNDKTIEERVIVYKNLGFGVGDVWEMFKKWPSFLTHSEKKITMNVETMKRCGLVEGEILAIFKKFPKCVSYSEQKIAYSIEAFLGLGFSREEVAMIFKRSPECIGFSVETVKKKTEFIVKNMNWPLTAIVSKPKVLGLSMEKRIVPRCNVIKALLSKGLLASKNPPMSSVLVCTTNEMFLNKFVRKHDDTELVAELMAIFTGSNCMHLAV